MCEESNWVGSVVDIWGGTFFKMKGKKNSRRRCHSQ